MRPSPIPTRGLAIAALRLLMLTGCRSEEMLTLKWDDVDRTSRVLRLRDAKRGPRMVPLPRPALKVPDGIERAEGVPWVFLGARPKSRLACLSSHWRRIKRETGLHDVRVHDLSHISAIEASGRDTLARGAVVTCEIVPGDRGPQVSRILSAEPPAAGHGPAESNQRFDSGYPGQQPGAAASTVMELPATVKFFDPARGFGFVVPDAGGPEVFVHSSVVFRSGMSDLAPGQRVLVRAESEPRGLQATEIEPLRARRPSGQ